MDVFRKVYTPLTDEAKQEMADVKDKAQELYDMIDKLVLMNDRSEKARCVAIAKTNLEQAIMWACKGITS